jgi:hypothetical protein
MSALNPFKVFTITGRYIGHCSSEADAQTLASHNPGIIVIVDERNGARQVRFDGVWVADGIDRRWHVDQLHKAASPRAVRNVAEPSE